LLGWPGPGVGGPDNVAGEPARGDIQEHKGNNQHPRHLILPLQWMTDKLLGRCARLNEVLGRA